MPQLLPWMEVYGLAPADVEGYWVCPGCARLVNRDLNRGYREMPLILPCASRAKLLERELERKPLIRIRPISREEKEEADSDTTNIANAVSNYDWWEEAESTLKLSKRIDQANNESDEDDIEVDDDGPPPI